VQTLEKTGTWPRGRRVRRTVLLITPAAEELAADLERLVRLALRAHPSRLQTEPLRDTSYTHVGRIHTNARAARYGPVSAGAIAPDLRSRQSPCLPNSFFRILFFKHILISN
jgi:hypothetical protein